MKHEALNASKRKYKICMCFTYQSWLIKRVFISHVTQKSAEKNHLKMEHAAV